MKQTMNEIKHTINDMKPTINDIENTMKLIINDMNHTINDMKHAIIIMKHTINNMKHTINTLSKSMYGNKSRPRISLSQCTARRIDSLGLERIIISVVKKLIRRVAHDSIEGVSREKAGLVCACFSVGVLRPLLKIGMAAILNRIEYSWM